MKSSILQICRGSRGRFLICLLALLWGSWRGLCGGSPLAAEDWPQWRGPRGDGTWNGPKLPETWPAAELPSQWRQPIGGGYGGIAVVKGRLYVMDRQKAPAEVERVLCWDAAQGTLLWEAKYAVQYGKLDYGNGPRATPTIHSGKLYTLGAVGHLHCLEALTGKMIWSKDFVKDLGTELPLWGLAASPVIWEELVIVHAGAKPDGCLLALDQATGKEVWRAGADAAGYCTPIVIASPSGPQLIAWTPEHIIGLSPRSGKIYWSVPYHVEYGVSIATPIYQENIVFISGYWAGSKAIQLGATLENAKLLWEENRNLRGLMAQPLYREGYVYSLDKQYGLTCFELQTGKKLWDDDNRMTPRGRNPQASFIWLDGGKSERILSLNSAGELILARLTPQGYAEQSRAKIIQLEEDAAPLWAHPAFAGRNIYARTDSELVSIPLPVSE